MCRSQGARVRLGRDKFVWVDTNISAVQARRFNEIQKNSERDLETDMLILTRRLGEKVVIGDDIYITLLGVRGSQARVGINAPKEVSVHREEIYHRIQQEKAIACAIADALGDARVRKPFLTEKYKETESV